MSHTEKELITREEVKKEFQLERMILFSDAVFAVVITLMALEIKLPENVTVLTEENVREVLPHLLPVVVAYAVSFIFIGIIWYRHLKIFSLLKMYDKGLVVRNLAILFFVGLFPFAASVITRTSQTMAPFYIYICVIVLCTISEYALHHYILVGRPELRNQSATDEHMKELDEKRWAVIFLTGTLLLSVITSFFISNPQLKPLAMMWMALMPLLFWLVRKKKPAA